MFRINLSQIACFGYVFLATFLICITSVLTHATVNVTANTEEYVVFAIDSRVINSKDSTIVTDSYEKLVVINDYSMIQISGDMPFNGKSFRSVIGEFCRFSNIEKDSTIDIDSLVVQFQKFITTKYNPKLLKDFASEFIIAALDKNGTPSVRLYRTNNDSIKPLGNDVLYINGQMRIAHRLIYGIDPLLQDSILAYMKRAPEIADTLTRRFSEFLSLAIKKSSLIYYNGIERWSLNNAIDYASFLVHATIVADEVSHIGIENDPLTALGIPTTGGQILIAVLRADGVLWIQRPLYYYRMAPLIQ